jgi:hypothetical protein
MKRIAIFLVLIASAGLLFGQDKPDQGKAEPGKPVPAKVEPSKNPVSDVVREIFARQEKNLAAAVDEMPADKFGYSPTSAQMTFGHLVIHISMSNIEQCSRAGSMPPPPMRPAPDSDKARLQAMLAKSFLYCEATVASALISLTNDLADHYSAAAIYLRLNGLLPPTTQEQK